MSGNERTVKKKAIRREGDKSNEEKRKGKKV